MSQTSRLLSVLFMFLAGLGLAEVGVCSAEEAESAGIFTRIINGRVVRGVASPVVKVVQSSSGSSYTCSGSMISRRAVLTASHCVSGIPQYMSVSAGGRVFSVRKVLVHPQAEQDQYSGLIYNDLAILKLKSAPKIKRSALLVSREVQAGDVLTILGFGLDEHGAYGVLRRGWTSVEYATSSFLVALFSSSSQSNACSGDSGGPAMLSYFDGAGVKRRGIVGVTSAGTSENCTIGDQTFYVNIQSGAALDWIVGQAPKTALR